MMLSIAFATEFDVQPARSALSGIASRELDETKPAFAWIVNEDHGYAHSYDYDEFGPDPRSMILD